MERRIQLGPRVVTDSSPPYVIAEIGVNHEGSLDLAKRLIDLAKQGGADAAKFQTYKADTLASKHSPAYWDLSKEPTTSQHKLFQKYDSFGPPEYRALAKHCEDVEIDFVSTPFDKNAVELLDPLMPFFKIASADLTNTPLLRQVAATGKPVVLSTGAATAEEVRWAVEMLRSSGCEELSLLHCVLNYPTADENAHLGMITALREEYPDLLIGYSDHTVPDHEMTALCTAYMLGARVIEKHFTHDKSLPGNDHYHAMDRNDLKELWRRWKFTEELLGSFEIKALPYEEPARKNARRSLVAAKDIAQGKIVETTDLTWKRPAHGISAKFYNDLIGKKSLRPIKEDEVLKWNMFE